MNKKILIYILIIILIIATITAYVFVSQNREQEEITNVEINDNEEQQINEMQSGSVDEQPIDENTIGPEETTISNWEWQRDTLENHKINSSVIQNIHNRLDNTKIISLNIVRNDYLVDEYYKDGYDETSMFSLNSCSKSVTSTILGIAIDKGFIRDVNVQISEYFPEEIENMNSEYAKEITIWHLLTHTSGINMSDTGNWDEWIASGNWVQYIFNQGMSSKPGTVFSYSTGNSHLLSAIIEKATGMTTYEFGKKYLFDPVGMESVECGVDGQGISDGGNGFRMNTHDMLRFGRLYLNKGNWNGEQIVSENWIEEATKLQFRRSSGSANYGYQWWVRTFGNNNYDAYFAQGHAGQYIFVVPELELIIAITSDYTGSTSIYWQLVNEIVNACEI